jgi:hypothetical protein
VGGVVTGVGVPAVAVAVVVAGPLGGGGSSGGAVGVGGVGRTGARSGGPTRSGTGTTVHDTLRRSAGANGGCGR